MINNLFDNRNFTAQSAANHKSAIQMNGIVRLKSKFKHLLSEWSGIITGIGRGLFIPLLAGLFFMAEVPPANAQTSTHTLSMFTTPDANQIVQGANVNFRLRMSSAPGHTIRQNVTISWEPANLVTSVCGRTPTPGQTTHTCAGGIIVWSNNTESNWHSAAVSTSASALSNTNGSITATLDTAQFAADYSNPPFHPTYDPDSTSLTVKVLKAPPPVVHLFSWRRTEQEGTALFVHAQANRAIASTDQVSDCNPGGSEKCLFVDVSITSQDGILNRASYNARVRIEVGRWNSTGYRIGNIPDYRGNPYHRLGSIDDLVNERTLATNMQATLLPNDSAYTFTVNTVCSQNIQFGLTSKKCKVLQFNAYDNDRVTASLSAEPSVRENAATQVKLVLDRKPWQTIRVGYSVSVSGNFLVSMPQNPTDFVVNPASLPNGSCDESRNDSVPNNTTNIDAAQCVFDLPDFVNDSRVTSAGGTLTVTLTSSTGTARDDNGYQTIPGRNDSVSVVVVDSASNLTISSVGDTTINEGQNIQFKFSNSVPLANRNAAITVNYRIVQGENYDFFGGGFQFTRTVVLPQNSQMTQTVSLSTDDDAVNEGTHDDALDKDRGRITVEILPGSWYIVDPSNNSVEFTVNDDDDPVITIAPITSTVSGGSENQFTLSTSSIAVGASVTVSFSVAAPGAPTDFLDSTTTTAVVEGTTPVPVNILGSGASSITSNVAVSVTLTDGTDYNLDSVVANRTLDLTVIPNPVIHIYSANRTVQEGGHFIIHAKSSRNIVAGDRLVPCGLNGSQKCLEINISVTSVGDIIGGHSTVPFSASLRIDVGHSNTTGTIGNVSSENGSTAKSFVIYTDDDLINENSLEGNITVTLADGSGYRVYEPPSNNEECDANSEFGSETNQCKILKLTANDNDRVTASLSAEPTIRESTSPQVKLVLDRKPWKSIQVGYTVSASDNFLIPLPENPANFAVNPADLSNGRCDESRNNSVPNNTTNIDTAQCVFDLPDFVDDDDIDSAGGELTVALTSSTGMVWEDNGYQTIMDRNDSVTVVVLSSDRNVSISRVNYNELDGITEGGDIQFRFSTDFPTADRTADITVNYRINQGENDDFFESGFQFTRTAVLRQNSLMTETVSIGTYDDSDIEEYGTVTVELLPGLWYTVDLLNNSIAYTVVDNELPLISISAVGTNILTEGGQIQFKFTTDFPDADRANDLTVHYEVSQGANYNFFGANFQNTRTATLPQNAMMSGTVSLSTVDDTVNEPNGNVIVKLLANPSYEISHIAPRNLIAFTVRDNDVPVIAIELVAATVSESSEYQFTLSASNFAAGETVTAHFTADDGNSEFLNSTRTAVINSTNPVRVNVLKDDLVEEDNGSVTVLLTDDDNPDYNLQVSATTSKIVFTVIDDDDPTTFPTIHIFSARRSGTEGDSFTVHAKSSRNIESTDHVVPCGVRGAQRCLVINISVTSVGDILRGHPTGTFPATLRIDVGHNNTTGTIGNVSSADGSTDKSFTIHTDDDLINENTPEGNITVELVQGDGYNMYSPPSNNMECNADREFGSEVNQCKVLKLTANDNDQVTASLFAASTVSVTKQVQLILDRKPWDTINVAFSATGGNFLKSNIGSPFEVTQSLLSSKCDLTKTAPNNNSTVKNTAQCVIDLPNMVNASQVAAAGSTLTVTLTAVTGATRDIGYQTITGQNDSVTTRVFSNDRILTISRVGTGDVVEGENIQFNFSISVPLTDRTADITVNYEIVQGENYDFFENGFQNVKTATLPQNSQMTQTVSISTDNDTVDEVDGDVTVRILPGSRYVVGDSNNSVVVGVSDNDEPVIIIQSDATIYRSSAHQFTLSTSSIAVGVSVTVAFTVTGGTGDFLNDTRTAVVDSTTPVEVNILSDDAKSLTSNETVTITLTDGDDYDLAETSSIEITVSAADNPSLPTVHIFSKRRAGPEGQYFTVRAKSSRIIQSTDHVVPCGANGSFRCLVIDIKVTSEGDIIRNYPPNGISATLRIEVGTTSTYGAIGNVFTPNGFTAKRFGFYTDDDLTNEKTPEGNITVELMHSNRYNVYSPPSDNPTCDVDSEFGNETKKCKTIKITAYDNDRVTASLSSDLTEYKDSASQATLVLDRKPWQTIHVEFNTIASGNFLISNLPTTLTVNPNSLSNGACDDSKNDTVPNNTTDASLAQCTIPLSNLIDAGSVPSTGGTLTVSLTSSTGVDRDTNHYQTITSRNDSVTLTIQNATGGNDGAGGASGESGPLPSFSQVRSFEGNVASFEIPEISISAVTPMVNEGDSVEFIIKASIPPNSELSVNVNLESKGDFAVSALPTSVVLNSDLIKTTIRIPTVDDSLAEDDGELTAELLEGENYAVNPQWSMAVVTISDRVDREHRRDQVSAASRLVVSKLLVSGSVQTLNATSDRMQLAFSEDNGNTFSINGKSDVTDMISLGGNALNGDLSDLKSLFGDVAFAVQLFPDDGLPNGSTFWGRSNLQEMSHTDSEHKFDLTGDVFSGYLGGDVMLPYNLLAGITTSYSEGQVAVGENGREEFDFLSRTTGVHPYLGWSDSSMGAQAMVVGGYGMSQLTMNQENYAEIQSDSSFNLFGVGGSKRILKVSHTGWDGTTELAVKGNVWTAQQYVEGDGNYLKNLTVATQQSRLGIDARHQFEFNEDSVLTPMIFMGMSGYEHEEETVQNWDLTGGVEFNNSTGFEVSSTSRYLFSPVSSVEDWQLSLSVEFDHGNDGLGWQYSFSTDTGNGMIGDNTKFGEFDRNSGIDFSDSDGGNTGFNSELGYGLSVLDGIAMFSPKVGFAIGVDDLETYSIGGKFDAGSKFKLAVEYSHGVQSNVPKEQLIDFNGRINW